jgi:hypothetical protein
METPDPGPDQVGIRTVFGAGRTASGS